MTFQPIVPLPGIAGWSFLQSTYDRQYSTFLQSPQIQRETEYFENTISSVTSAAELVSDRRLLDVALGAFGLSEDINNRAFVQKILEDGIESNDALANRLADDRYRSFSRAFGFGPEAIVQTGRPDFAASIIEKFNAERFEISVGDQDETMRIALYAQRELSELATDNRSNDAQWFSIMGVPALREYMQTALNLPDSFGQLDIDRQLEEFKSRARASFGSENVVDIVSEETLNDITNAYLARSQIDTFGQTTSSASIALSLLSAAR